MKNLCIVIPIESAYSETFINNHIKYLNFNKITVYGTALSEFKYEGEFIFSRKWYHRIIYKLKLYFFGDRSKLESFIFSKFLRRLKIDVVLAEYGPTGAILCRSCEHTRTPLVVHFHGYDASTYSVLEEYTSAYKKMFEVASIVIAVSGKMVKRLEELGAPNNKIRLNEYGIDTDLFKCEFCKDSNVLISVGRFVDKKAPHLTILAFYKAWKHDNNLRLLMVGEGPLLNACKELVFSLKLCSAVAFVGVKSPLDIAGFMSESFAFIQHSVIAPDGNAEGTPLSILEASASGLPVISTRHEGIMDAVIENVSGILVDEYDVDAMSKAILTLHRDRELAFEFGVEGRRIIKRQYTLEKHIQGLEKLLNPASDD